MPVRVNTDRRDENYIYFVGFFLDTPLAWMYKTAKSRVFP